MADSNIFDAATSAPTTQAPAGGAPSGNIFDGATGGTKPPPVVRKQAAKPQGPFSALLPVLHGAERAVGTGVSNVFDVLNRPHEAVTAAITGGAGRFLPTLVHGQSAQSQDQTRAELRKKIGLAAYYDALSDPGATVNLGNGLAVPGHVGQGILDFLLDTGTDPMMLAGGSGALEHLGESGGMRAIPAFARVVTALERGGPKAQHAAQGLQDAFDFTHYKGKPLLQLAARNGVQGVSQFHGLKAINNARLRRARDMADAMTRELESITKGLTPAQKGELFSALHTGEEASLPADLQPRAQAFSTLTDTLAYLSGTRKLRAELQAHGFQLPKWAQRFDTQIRSLQRPSQYRANYVPTVHDFDTVLGPNARPGSLEELDQRIKGESLEQSGINTSTGPFRRILDAAAPSEENNVRRTAGLHASDANLKPRDNNARLLDPEMQERVIQARLRGGAAAISARDAEREVARLFGVGGFQKAPGPAQDFFRETYNTPDGKSFWAGIARSAIDIPKFGLFALPFRHMANIGTLSFLADPSMANVYGTAGRFARLLLAGADAAKRDAPMGLFGRNFLPYMTKADKYGVSGVPSIDKNSAGWIGKIPLIGDFYKMSNNVLWSFDDAAKATRFDRLLKHYQKQGMKESQAAYKAASDVGAELIDYSNRSPLTKALAYIAPFATYRSKLPGAVARATIRHPERILTAGRISPELIGDEQQGPPGQVGKSYLPVAEALRVADNPMEFARSTGGYPWNMLLSAANVHGDDYPNYFTYGKAPDLKYLVNASLGSFPGVQAGLSALGYGEFANQGGVNDTLRSITGFSLTTAPSQRETKAFNHVLQQRALISELRANGQNAAADAAERKLKQYLKFNRLFEK